MPLSAVDPSCYPQLLALKCERVCALLAPTPRPDGLPVRSHRFRMRAEFRSGTTGMRSTT